MEPNRLALAGLLLAGAALAQQPAQPRLQPPVAAQPAQPGGQPAAPSRLDFLLGRWEQEMTAIQTLAAELNRTTLDKTWGTTDIFTGTAKYMRPNLAVLEMHKKSNPQLYEKYLCSGTFLYQYVPASKVIHVYELPPPQPGQPVNKDFLTFLFGMKAEDAKKRYDLKLVKEDQWYVYIEVMPRLQADKADFTKARLVLNVSNFLPRQVNFEQPNGNAVTWDLPKIATGVQLDRSEFTPPGNLPAGWNLVRVPRADAGQPNPVKPTVVRPND